MTVQQVNDYYYGYNLRLADEIGGDRFEECIKQPATLSGKIELTNELKKELLNSLLDDSILTRRDRERRIFEEVFNDPLDEREQEFIPSY